MVHEGDTITPLRVMGLKISYYTGKFEGYLRYKEIPYEFVTMEPAVRREVVRRTGAAQMPAVALADGRWMTDSTPMIAWLEEQFPEPAVIPVDPVQRFFSLLLEDYAEEWLWRPAMHYRWSYRRDALQLSRTIADEMLTSFRVPGALKRAGVRRRQIGGWAKGDGVTDETWDHIEGCYTGALSRLSTILADRPFLLGERPTIADFGYFASMFRHFGQDPTPAHIMRETAPLVYEWQAGCGRLGRRRRTARWSTACRMTGVRSSTRSARRTCRTSTRTCVAGRRAPSVTTRRCRA